MKNNTLGIKARGNNFETGWGLGECNSSPLTTVLCKNLDYCESKFVILSCTNFDSKLSKFLLRTQPLNGQKH